MDVIVLKPRRNSSPHVVGGTAYTPVEDEAGVYHITVTDPEHLAVMARLNDTYLVPQNAIADQPAKAEDPVAVVPDAAPTAPADAVKPDDAAVKPDDAAVKPAKRRSRL